MLGLTLGTILSPWADGTWLEMVNLNVFRPIGQLFLRLIFMIVVPLVVSALVVGVYELGRSRDLRGVAMRTLLWTVALSTASVVIGILVVNLVRPGDGLDMSGTDGAETAALQANAAARSSFADTIVDLVPQNPVAAATGALEGQMLPLMVASLVFGIALSRLPSEGRAQPLIPLLEQVFAACMAIVGYVMRFAPLAVFSIVFGTALTFGSSLLGPLLLYVGTVVLGLLLQQVVVYPSVLRAFAGRSPLAFLRACRSVYLYAFSTASSNATLPLSMEAARVRLGIPERIGRFVLTVGATANQNGTALFEGVTVMFLAQAYGLDLSLGEQVRVMVMSIVAGIGTAGVPGGSLPMVLVVAQSVGVPAEGMALILGVDRFLDMCRTTVNVGGDLVIAALVAEGEPGDEAA